MGKKYKKYKNFLEKYLDSSGGKRFFNVVYSVGAAIVILGAMFKILHLPYGNQMLMIGMITEAIVFLLSAFEKPAKDYKWEEVYPALSDSSDFIPRNEREDIQEQTIRTHGQTGTSPAIQSTSVPSSSAQSTGASTNTQTSSGNRAASNTGGSVSSGNVSGGYNGSDGGGGNGSGGSSSRAVVIGGSQGGGNAGSSQQGSTTTGTSGSGSGLAGNITIVNGGGGSTGSGGSIDISDKDVTQLAQATESMEKFAKVTDSLSKISDSLQAIIGNTSGLDTNTQGYIAQMENLNRNIAGLNTIYEVQLKGISGQIHSIEHINAGLDRMKRLYDGSLADSSIFKHETERMAQQLAELNRVYARLLQAMTTNMNMTTGFNPNLGGDNTTPPQP